MQTEALKSWTWSSNQILTEEREHAWSDTLNRISLPPARARAPERNDFHGDICNVMSPLGIEFSLLEASPQTISGRCANSAGTVWLALLIDGKYELNDGGRCIPLQCGDILYGPGGRDSTLELTDDFRLLHISIPAPMLHPRLLNPVTLQCGALPAGAGGHRVFGAMLHAIANNLSDLSAAQMRPVEIALSEFVIAGLAEASSLRSFGNVARAAHFHRICQAIEAALGDPELSVRKIADGQHASARYVQKLFEEADLSFGQYVRQRRLAHCRADLASAAHHNLSILDICFRWGFNDAAHFSRSFRAEFDITPRAYRQSQLGKRLQ
jgi:AraC-like DNA-binding protein